MQIAGLVLLGGAILLVLTVWFSRPRDVAYAVAHGPEADITGVADGPGARASAAATAPEIIPIEPVVEMMSAPAAALEPEGDLQPMDGDAAEVPQPSLDAGRDLSASTSTGSGYRLRMHRVVDSPATEDEADGTLDGATRTVTYPLPIPVPVAMTTVSPVDPVVIPEIPESAGDSVPVSRDRPFESQSAAADSLTFVPSEASNVAFPAMTRQWQGSQSSIARVSSIEPWTDARRRRALLAGAGLAFALVVAARH